MFWGRVGILGTFIFGLLKGEFRGNVSYPDADIPHRVGGTAMKDENIPCHRA